MVAFQGAVDLGYRYIETDVHATADGVVLAFHDDRLERVTNASGVIGELDYSTVSMAKVDGTEPIPLLADMLAAWPHVKFNIDPKHDAVVEPLVDLIKQTGALDRICITAFSERRLRACRDALGPNLCTATGPREMLRLRLKSWGMNLKNFPAACAQIPLRRHGIQMVDRAFIDTAHDLGRQVHVWTIDDQEQMVRLIELGVDGIMTDRPRRLKRVLTDRGLWRG